MSLVGNLADLPLTDIFQIVSLSRRTGILNIAVPDGKASITFMNGHAIKASSSWNKLRLGSFLKQKGLITDKDEVMILYAQKENPVPFGTLLVENDIVSRSQMEESLQEYIQTVIVGLLALEEGTFDFELLSSPGEVLPPNGVELILENGVDTQHLIIEGLRLLDEKRHKNKIEEKKNNLSDIGFSSLIEETPVSVSESIETLSEKDNTGHPEGLWESIHDEITVDDITGDENEPAPAPKLEDETPGFLEQLFSEVGEEFEFEQEEAGKIGGISSLKSMVEELKEPNSLSEVLLLILRYASEFLNRAALFVVREGEIRGFGQFGLSGDDNLANDRIRSTLIPDDADSILSESVRMRSKVQRPLDDEKSWDRYLCKNLGGETPEESIVIPVINSSHTIALLYGDNGSGAGFIGDIQALEIFIIQAGFVLDRFLLESKLEDIRQR